MNETDRGTVLIFPGRKFGTLTRGKYGPGTLHGVRDTQRSMRHGNNRRAIVSFVHARLAPSDVAWHLQKKAEGFFTPDPAQFFL